jgi:hypothetical protein
MSDILINHTPTELGTHILKAVGSIEVAMNLCDDPPVTLEQRYIISSALDKLVLASTCVRPVTR